MSALPSKTDIARRRLDVRLVPKAAQSGVIRLACRKRPQVFLRWAQQDGVYY